MPIPAPQILCVEIAVVGQMSSGGSNSVNTANIFHYRRTANVNPVVKAQIDTAFQAQMVVPLALALNNRWLQVHNTVRYIDDAFDAPAIFSHNSAGAVAGDSMTSIEAAFILMQTGLRGKSNRGSKHFGPLSEADTTLANEDIFNAAALARWATVVAAMAAGFTDAGANIWLPCVVSRKQSTIITNPTNIVRNDVTAVLLNKRIGRMRRREVKSVY